MESETLVERFIAGCLHGPMIRESYIPMISESYEDGFARLTRYLGRPPDGSLGEPDTPIWRISGVERLGMVRLPGKMGYMLVMAHGLGV